MKNNYFFTKTKLWVLLPLFLLLFSNGVMGQAASTYTFAATTGTYTALVSPTTVNFASGTSPYLDEGYFNGIPIGFNFVFNSVTYTHAHVSTNGWATLGTSAANNTLSATGLINSFTSGTYGNPILAALWDDNAITTNNSDVSYKTTGTAGSQVFTIQFSNVKWQYNATGAVMNFQIKLYEGTNVIQYVYSQGVTAVSSGSASIGISNSTSSYLSVGTTVTTAATASSSTNTTSISTKPSNNLVFTFTPPAPPTITNLTAATSGCVGSNLVITGSNFTGVTGASAVKIGGTNVTSYTVDSATQITAVVASGTTGTVAVTNTGGTATSVGTFTINQLPTTTWAATATSKCFSASAQTTTFAYTATTNSPTLYSIDWNAAANTAGLVDVTDVAFAGTAGGGTITLNIPAGLVAGTYTANIKVKTANGCINIANPSFTLTINGAPAITTNPANTSVVVGGNTTLTAAGSNTPTSYLWEVNTGSGFTSISNGGVYSTATTATLTITGATFAMNGYLYRATAINSCGSSAVSTSATLTVTYCTAGSSAGTVDEYISNVTINTINNTSSIAPSSPYYTSFTGVSTSLTQSVVYPITIQNGGGTYSSDQAVVYVDFNNNGVFTDSGESFTLTQSGTTGLFSGNVTVPAGATIGNVRMRVRLMYTGAPSSCGNATYGEVEDYTIIVVAPLVPTITGLSAASGCVGSNLVITGTNFTGASAVKIGGTAVTSYTVDSATQITAVVGTATTGTVAVTNTGGTATSVGTFTINQLPTTTWAATAASKCFSASVQTTTLAYTATTISPTLYSIDWNAAANTAGLVDVTDVAFAGTVGGGTITLNIPAGLVAGTYTANIKVKNANGCIGTANPSFTLTINGVPAITINPANTSVSVGGNTTLTAAGSNTPTSYLWEVNTGSGFTTISNGGVYSTATTGTLTITGANQAMNGYLYRATAINGCGSSAVSTSATLTVTYCTPAPSSVDGTGITNVSFSSVNNTTGAEAGNYGDYSAMVGTGTQGTTLPVSITTNTTYFGIGVTYQVEIFVDWNNDFDFADAGEDVYSGSVTNGTLAASLSIPSTATVGNHRIRIGGLDVGTPTPCYVGTFGTYEDYTLNVLAKAVCTVAPSVTTPTDKTIGNGGNTTFASTIGNLPDSIVWEVSTDGGINYSTITNGGVYSTATTATLTITAASYSMNGFKYRVKATNNCGATTSGVATLTVTLTYCVPTSTTSTTFINNISSTGTLADVVSGANSTGYSGSGYKNNSAITLARQIPGGAINFDVDQTSPNGSFISIFVDWNADGDFLDTGEKVYNAGAATDDTSFGFIVPTTQTPGNYRMRIRTRDYNDSSTIVACATGYATGEAEDFTISIVADCAAKIASVIPGSNCSTGTVTIGAVGSGSPTEYRWYSAETGGTLLGTTTTGSWTTPSITATTTYYVTCYNGSCESLVRVAVKATIKAGANISFTPAVPLICGTGTILNLSATGDSEVIDLFTEDFESGTYGNFTLNTIGATNGAETFTIRTSSYLPSNTTVFKPAVNSGGAGTTLNKFAFAVSDVNLDGSGTPGVPTTTSLNTALQSGVINTTGYTSLTLQFDHYYSHYSSDTVFVEASINGGTSWTTVTTYTADDGSAGNFATKTVNFTPYINQSNFKFRIRYNAIWDDGYAVDNFRLYGSKPLTTTFDWGVNTGDMYSNAGATVPYVSHALASQVWIKPDASVGTTWTYTANTTLANGCVINKTINVPNNTKIWNGLAGSDYNAAGSWFPSGTPTIANCVEIPTVVPSPVVSSTANAKSVTLTTATANLNVNTGQTITVADKVTVTPGAVFNIDNGGSLVQVTDGITNSGNIIYKRTATARLNDYVYWSSPVISGPVSNTIFSPLAITGTVYKWDPLPNNGVFGTGANSGTQGQGKWISGVGAMTPAVGYIMRMPVGTSASTAEAKTATFTGVPNNGIITTPIYRGGYTGSGYTTTSGAPVINTDDNYNLVGNPYPSAISANQFLFDNPSLSGFVQLWSHGNLPATWANSPYYNNSATSIYYKPTDYITYNNLGTSSGPGSVFIAAGQGFMVNYADGATGNTTISFKNGQRSAAYNNTTSFMKSAQSNTVATAASRIWVDVVNANNESVRTMVGYADDATLGKDRMYDAVTNPGTSMNIFTMINDEAFNIQGRPRFDPSDVVPVGVTIPAAGTYNIALAFTDGLFDNHAQTIYVKDNALNTIHDLTVAPYQFTASTGIITNRFELVYQNALGTNAVVANHTTAYIKDNKLNVRANNNISNIQIFDLAGKLIKTYNPKESSKQFSEDFSFARGIYLAKIKTDDGNVVSEKLMN